ncbi:Hypothetical predicted protein [Olea europaea subsp. europaea]|uniref:Uncharacterized protein n=1 Tax=Olea europaea subsp. europaea TaxID=158383 RepID=A0A8S0STS6_OLEEU|nr:Hypothetical predicted protein [Olea europaea subsp. europaea]
MPPLGIAVPGSIIFNTQSFEIATRVCKLFHLPGLGTRECPGDIKYDMPRTLVLYSRTAHTRAISAIIQGAILISPVFSKANQLCFTQIQA